MKGNTMKTFHFSKILLVFVFVAAAVILSGSAPTSEQPSASFSLKDLPPIELENCIAVQKVIAHNPFSPNANDYLLVTRYEEKSNETVAMREGLKPGSAFNMYLVYGVLVPVHQGIGIVHDTVLIVKVSAPDVESSRETVREWILIDENGDRKVDRGVFREAVREEGKSPVDPNEVAFPEDRLQELQAYYEAATVTLDGRAEKEPAEGCIAS